MQLEGRNSHLTVSGEETRMPKFTIFMAQNCCWQEDSITLVAYSLIAREQSMNGWSEMGHSFAS